MENEQQPISPMINNDFDSRESEIDLAEIFFALIHRLPVIILGGLLGSVLLLGIAYFIMNSSYTATSMIYITNTDTVISVGDLTLGSQLAEDYKTIIKSSLVLKQVVKDLDLDITYKQLDSMLTIDNPDSTHILKLSVTADSAVSAISMVNSVTDISIEKISKIVGKEPSEIVKAEPDTINIIAPSMKGYMLKGFLLGAALVCGVISVLVLLNMTINSEEDVEKYLGLPVLSVVPYNRYKKHKVNTKKKKEKNYGYIVKK